jgi:flavin-dependent dehydrogenase
VIPRDELDSAMLQTAERAGARVHQETTVTAVRTGSDGVTIEARRSSKSVRYRSRLVVGADGANSIVAASAGVLADDPRHTAVAQRAYAIGVEGELGEVEVFFDEQMFPGYGWMFPIAGGRVNLGVGILSETRRRLDLNVPGLFADFVDRLRNLHPRCASLELCAPPIGGIVKTYGGAGRNFFEGGLLIGDAGSFVDPMTGEGITPAAESALLAAPVLLAALESGRSDAECLSKYETAFRAYFDPAMTFLDFCAAVMRNRHFARAWLNTLARGCELAQTDQAWARTGGSYFGGLDIRPVGILAQVWIRLVPELLFAWPRSLGGVASRRATTVAELIEWQSAWSRSFVADPLWHARWQMDVQRKSLRLASMNAARDPRAAGIPD